MPAAIRVDVELFSVSASDERPAAVKPRVRVLADDIAEAVRLTVVQFAKDTAEETGNEEELVRVMVQEGLGNPWPPPDGPSGAQPIGQGAAEYVKRLAAGEDVHNLRRAEHYAEGAFHVIVRADFG
jgi:hypothetical protein